MQDKIQAIRSKIEELVKLAKTKYDVDMPAIQVRLDLKGRTAGMAIRKGQQLTMRLNIDMIKGDSWEYILNDTIPHEMAHLVCFVNPALGRNHDWGWQMVCRGLGGTGKRCHDQEVKYAKGNTYDYTTSTGHVIALSSIRHRKVQQGAVYHVRGKGSIHKQCEYQLRA